MSAFAPFASDPTETGRAHTGTEQEEIVLSRLPRGLRAEIRRVACGPSELALGNRLHALGFVQGEFVRVVGCGPWGAEPLLIQVGHTRFALRRREAALVIVRRIAG